MKLTVDPRHWLDKNGNIPLEPARLRRNMLRIARIIEYGGPLKSGTMLHDLQGGGDPRARLGDDGMGGRADATSAGGRTGGSEGELMRERNS